jgi:hypothetical protein
MLIRYGEKIPRKRRCLVVCTPEATGLASGFASPVGIGAGASVGFGVEAGLALAAIGSSMSGFFDAQPVSATANTRQVAPKITEELRLEWKDSSRIEGILN